MSHVARQGPQRGARKTLSLDKDIILINVYDSDERSSYKKNKTMDNDHVSTLENLLQILASNDDCEIFLAGDLNARTGGLNFIPEHNDWEDKTKQSECKIQRSSRDSIINTRGHKFLDFISSCNLSILNGCTLGDVFGEFICMRYNGNSVVDYMATSPRLRNTVQSFEVGELTKSLSDHRPICTFNIKSNIVNAHDLLGKHDNAPLNINWVHNHSFERFTHECTENVKIKSTNHEINITACETEKDVLALNTKIVATYNQIGNNIGVFKIQNKTYKNRSVDDGQRTVTKKTKMKQKWFDAECIVMKRELIQSERRYVKKPDNTVLRSEYYSRRK